MLKYHRLFRSASKIGGLFDEGALHTTACGVGQTSPFVRGRLHRVSRSSEQQTVTAPPAHHRPASQPAPACRQSTQTARRASSRAIFPAHTARADASPAIAGARRFVCRRAARDASTCRRTGAGIERREWGGDRAKKAARGVHCRGRFSRMSGLAMSSAAWANMTLSGLPPIFPFNPGRSHLSLDRRKPGEPLALRGRPLGRSR